MRPALGVLLFSGYSIRELVELSQLSEALGYRFFWYTDVRFARVLYRLDRGSAGDQNDQAGTWRHRVRRDRAHLGDRNRAFAAGVRKFACVEWGRAGRMAGRSGRPQHAELSAEVNDDHLLRGGAVSAQGEVISLDGGRLLFEPVRREIPIYFATHGEITVLADESPTA
jgi:alkanesulfonate monooxygenase SsuD/methylene tetrahydromethanopterin reductase-like flavin-dependent oxidoreductase (luciferase family)